jgi:hypothetical protein
VEYLQMDSVTCLGCRAQVLRDESFVIEESTMARRDALRDPNGHKYDATYCRTCINREHPECVPAVACAACRRVAGPGDRADDTWIRIDADGAIIYPAGGRHGLVTGKMPKPPNGAEAVCDVRCLSALRERREQDAAR